MNFLTFVIYTRSVLCIFLKESSSILKTYSLSKKPDLSESYLVKISLTIWSIFYSVRLIFLLIMEKKIIFHIWIKFDKYWQSSWKFFKTPYLSISSKWVIDSEIHNDLQEKKVFYITFLYFIRLNGISSTSILWFLFKT